MSAIVGKNLLSKHFSQDGLDVTVNANGDYSSGEAHWEIRPAGDVFIVSRMLITIEDNTPLDTGNYGGSSALSNGLIISHVRGDGYSPTILSTLTDVPITRNIDWSRYSYDTRVDTFGTGNNFLSVRLSFHKFGAYMRLHSNRNEALRITMTDDLSSLIGHFFVAQGYRLVQ
jgi:hypothetical protein